MKRVFVAFSILASAVAAQADMLRPAVVDITCTGQGLNQKLHIVSNKTGTVVSADGKEVLRQEQVVAGTEGGPAYLQVVGGGYNITISGGDFVDAFNSGKGRNGKSLVSIWTKTGNKTYKGECTGRFW